MDEELEASGDNHPENRFAGEGVRGRRAFPFAERLTCSVAEACDVTGLGKTKLYELIASGTFRTKNVGRRRLVLVQSLRAWLLDDQ